MEAVFWLVVFCWWLTREPREHPILYREIRHPWQVMGGTFLGWVALQWAWATGYAWIGFVYIGILTVAVVRVRRRIALTSEATVAKRGR